VKLTRFVVLLGLVLALLGGAFVATDSALADVKKGDDGGGEEEEPAVRITGGTVTNDTVIDISANGNTAIADGSGGDNNVALTISDLEADVASAGNGGTATASANGGAVSVGNVNSGGNTGNAITVGNTHADGGGDHGGKPVCCDKPGGGKPGGGAKGGVKALPSTGVGAVAGVSGSALFLALGALGAAGYSLRRRSA
jgi:hypothetical protein